MSSALITGATSGIGEALATLLAKKGFALILVGRNEQKLDELKKRLPVAVTTLFQDLATSRDKVCAIIEERAPDLLINCAGFGVYGEALQADMQEQLDMIHVNCSACVELSIVGARALMAAKKGGVILNISSIAALHPAPLMAVYAASKAFVRSFSKALAMELEGNGIHVLTSLPGQVATAFASRAAKKEVAAIAQVISVEKAAEAVWWQIERKKREHIFDWRYRLALFVAKLLPERFIGTLIQKSIEKRL